MSLYRDAVKNNKLFQEFDRLAGFEDVSLSDVDILKAMVLAVAETAGPHLDRIQHTFQQYTAHDIQHLLNIADHVHDFLPRATVHGMSVVGLNAVELAYLWLAILLHDVGMFVSQTSEKQAIIDSTDYQDFLRHHRDRLAVARAAEEAGRTVTAQAINDALLAEFIRRRHAERVHGYIHTHLKDQLRFRQIDLSVEVGNLCESHNWGVRAARDMRSPQQCVERLERRDFVGKTRVNLVYLACCLRLGDILDFDRSRTPLSAFHQIHFTEALSVQEWNKHLSIKGINVSEHRVQYAAKCAAPADYISVHHFLDWVDRELQECTLLVREFPQTDAERYVLNLTPVVDRHQIRMANPQMVAGAFRFQLDYDRIMHLLMDKSLYPDETLFLRELLQNALDACRYQRALAQDKGMGDKYVPRIQVEDYSAAPPVPVGRDQGPRIIFRDNGVGMSLHQVENYFMRVGKSFYTSSDFQAERERLAQKGIHFDACSQFGIGFLSCFLGGDRIEVETYRYGNEPLKIVIDGPSKYFVIERLNPPSDSPVSFNSPLDPALDSPPRCSGTKVTVFLRDGWHKNPSASSTDLVHQTLDAVAVNQDVPIILINPKDVSSRVLEASRWDRVPPEMPLDGFPLIPSIFSLANFGEGMRGQGAIWFISDNKNPAIRKCDLILNSGYLCLAPSLVAVLRLLEGAGKGPETRFKSLTKALDDLRKSPSKCDAIRARLQRQYGKYYIPAREELLAITEADIDWAMRVAQAKPKLEIEMHWIDADMASIAASGDRDELINKMQIARMRQLPIEIISRYEFSLFGIKAPGGFQTWEPARGTATRHNWLPPGVSVSVDTYGDLAPQPAASRLYVPYERSRPVQVAVSRAFLRYARQLWKSHGPSDEWSNWYMNFLIQIYNTNILHFSGDSNDMHFLTEFRIACPKMINEDFQTIIAMIHSKFGMMIVHAKFDGILYRGINILKPISEEHICWAAAEVGLETGKINSAVESLSEFLGWDIRKGFSTSPAPAASLKRS